MQDSDAPDHVLSLPTQEEQKDICYVDANRRKETHNNKDGDDSSSSTGNYSYLLVLETPYYFSF